MIVAVLVVPVDGDPAGLVADGVCGSTPPTAWRTDPTDPGPGFAVSSTSGGRIGWSDPTRVTPPRMRAGGHGDMYVYRIERALVLAWAGEVVPAGVFRLWYAVDDVLADRLSDALYEKLDVLTEEASAWCRIGRNGAPVGRIVLLDADGREVTT